MSKKGGIVCIFELKPICSKAFEILIRKTLIIRFNYGLYLLYSKFKTKSSGELMRIMAGFWLIILGSGGGLKHSPSLNLRLKIF
jgi:hypothetical protein